MANYIYELTMRLDVEARTQTEALEFINLQLDGWQDYDERYRVPFDLLRWDDVNWKLVDEFYEEEE